MPFGHKVEPALYAARGNALDEPIFKKLAGLRLPPSPECDDQTFIRRAFLDAIGALPTADQVSAFLADPRPDKRAQLVEAILARPEWVDYWTLQLADLLQNRKERDHDVRGTKGVRAFHEWLRAQLTAGRGWRTPSLPDADPRSGRPRCGGRESKFLAGRRKFLSLVPKLQLGHALVCEAPLRRRG